MNVLSNAAFPSSSKIRLIPFGTGDGVAYRYDNSRPFPEFLNEVRDKEAVDAVFFYYPEYHFIPPALEEADIPLFALVSDWNLGYFSLKGNLGRFDTLVTDKGGCRQFRAMGYDSVLQWNMYGYQPSVYADLPPATREWDILFVGNVNPYVQKERSLLLKRLFDLSGRFKVRVETRLFGADYVNALRSAKIIFNRSIRGEANMRVFEALATDSLVFLESANEEIRDLLAEDECVLYDDRSLETALEYWITHDREREAVIQRAARKKERYGYPAMLDRLHDLIAERELLKPRPKHRPCFVMPQTQRRYHAVLQAFYASSQPADAGWVTRELNGLMRSAETAEQKGLLLLSLYHKFRGEGGLSPAEIGIARRLFPILSRESGGRLFRHFNYAVLMAESGNAAEALPVLEALRLLLSRPDIPAEEYTGAPCLLINENFYQEINLLLYRGDPESFEPLRKILLNLCLTRLGPLYLSAGRPDDARTALEEAVRVMERNDLTFFLLGRMVLEGNPLVAFRYFRSAFALNPFQPQYWPELLGACIVLKRNEEGLEFLEQIRRIEHLSRKIYIGCTFADLASLETRLRERSPF